VTRREAIAATVSVGVLGVAFHGIGAPEVRKLPEATPKKLPKWRGFNLLEKFNVRTNKRFLESDFEWIAELGFNFVRLPMDYRCWIEPNDWTKFREDVLKEIDEAVSFGEKYGIHVCINFHRAPGYTVARPPEAKSLWVDEEARKVCAMHWRHFAERYKGIPNSQLSFNLFNEPPRIAPEVHRKVVEQIVEAIRERDEQRLIICDGRDWGNTPPTELVGLNVAAATRGYQPMRISHYRAEWIGGADKWAEPTYPLKEDGSVWDINRLREFYRPWKELENKGVGVMVGEFGAYNKTPHKVVLAWMRDCLQVWKELGFGWALWNFRGSFGILDSGRNDVAYEDWRGHKLDREMLELLQAF